jgi:DNA repair protein RecN (Recombination protein N)
MLRHLHLSGLGVIEDLDLELNAGLNVLTGETGAGKTMVVLALGLVTGARGSAQLVRAGAGAARIQASFDAPEGAEEWAEDGEVLLSRTVGADGRSGARIGGQLATVSTLGAVGRMLLEVHGQNQSLRLLEPSTQTALLDRSAGDAHVVAVASYRETFEALTAADSAIDELRRAARDRAREMDLLEYQVREIRGVAPEPGETASVESEEVRLAHVERLQELAGGARAALGEEGGAADSMSVASRALADAASVDGSVVDLASRAAALAAEAAELARDLRTYIESLAADPERLEAVRARIAELKSLQRKYGSTDEEVMAFGSEAEARLQVLARSDDRLTELEQGRTHLVARLEELAARLTRTRLAAAANLERALDAELKALGMPQASLRIVLEPQDVMGPTGAEKVELRLSAGEGQPLLPLVKAASGGELSRVMLACRSVLANLDEVPTLVFDEVDAGIGGEAGLAVGRRLANLAATRQVIVVTHLPQIACFADAQFRVNKSGGEAGVEPVRDDERVRELARMLAGLGESAHASSHAEELLAEASRVRTSAS